MMLELSPLDTAANASACSIPAVIRTSRSNPIPVTVSPVNSEPSRRKASASWSTTATACPRASRVCARVEPTRPQPMITMCTCAPPGRQTVPSPTACHGYAGDGASACPPGPGGSAVRLTVVARPTSLLKRLLIGRPFRSDRMHHTLLPKRIALPVFASDALSSVSSGVENLGSAWGFAAEHKVEVAVVLVVILTALNLRGVREAGAAFSIPTYAFMGSILLMIGWGLFRFFILGDQLRAESANLTVTAPHEIVGFAFVFLMVRTFSSGCTALTGVEAISNGVPAFKPPKSRNAATTLLLLGSIAITMLLGIVVLSRMTGLQFVESPDQIESGPAGYVQHPVSAQLAR